MLAIGWVGHAAHGFLGRLRHRPGVLETFPEQVVHTTAIPFTGQPGANQVAHVEQGAEEGEEEHHFGEDEPEHAQHIGFLQLCAVQAGEVFLDRHAEPAEQRGREDEQADKKNTPGAARGAVAEGHVVHDIGGTKGTRNETDGGTHRQLAFLRYVILLVLC